MKNLPTKNRPVEMPFAGLKNYKSEQLIPLYLRGEIRNYHTGAKNLRRTALADCKTGLDPGFPTTRRRF